MDEKLKTGKDGNKFNFQNWDTNMSIFPTAPDILGLSKFATQHDLGRNIC